MSEVGKEMVSCGNAVDVTSDWHLILTRQHDLLVSKLNTQVIIDELVSRMVLEWMEYDHVKVRLDNEGGTGANRLLLRTMQFKGPDEVRQFVNCVKRHQSWLLKSSNESSSVKHQDTQPNQRRMVWVEAPASPKLPFKDGSLTSQNAASQGVSDVSYSVVQPSDCDSGKFPDCTSNSNARSLTNSESPSDQLYTQMSAQSRVTQAVSCTDSNRTESTVAAMVTRRGWNSPHSFTFLS